MRDHLSKARPARDQFEDLMLDQLGRVDTLRQKSEKPAKKDGPLVIGVCGGDGIGPMITQAALELLKYMVRDDLLNKKVQFSYINNLTLEHRLLHKKAIPDDVMEQLLACDVVLKGPTTTPQHGDGILNLESANVAMRKAMDLYANVRPVRVPKLGIDWTFFRENTEGAYLLGSEGIRVGRDLAVDFTVATRQGCQRIIEAAFKYARKNNKTRVTAVTKANVIKTTDGMFLEVARRVAKYYPTITLDEWYIDIMAAKLLDDKRRRDFQVLVMPNLYGDILTDEAAELMGGVGTAGSANIGTHYAMFEAIHGSAPRMVTEGRAQYADPVSMMRAAAMLLNHIGRKKEARHLDKVLDTCALKERKYVITGRDTGATCAEFTQYVKSKIR
jgi:isocitrate dehydrogenase (NAD+)